MYCIVIAWVEDAYKVDDAPHRADLGEQPIFIPCKEACAAVWKNDAEQSDITRALDYAASRARGMKVFTYPADVPDPLRRARREVMA